MADGDHAAERDELYRLRDEEADAREDAADRREQADDIREGVLDRWERELILRATELDVLDGADETVLERGRRQRAEERRRRRVEADERREAAVRRGIERLRPSTADPDASGAMSILPQAGALARLAAVVDGSTTVTETLEAILDLATDVFPDADAATITLVVDGRLEPAVATATWAGDLDATQVRTGAGPLVDAVRTGAVALSADLAGDDRGRFDAGTGSEGARGVISAPISVGDDSSGALTIYTAPGRRLDDRADLVALMLAAQASVAVGWSLARHTYQAQADAWERALASRDLIGQAKGVLMAQRGISADEAFELMRTTSQRQNVKVRDIADHVTTHQRLPGE
ncbi:GAF and ANTAR domain-containing protein [Desertimonas flava]|uniref:GAF and ANTAR domain-containing protein n=1 Tax=Desertimonas flava TaxID=2064846 RepID=UPI000E349AC2|nr:GAF and ANTAR domain-containing protein [Desertimonas flava]